MLSINNVSKHFGATPLFRELSLQINPKERIALAGRNGAGKTTLLEMIAGRSTPTEGTISKPADLVIGYLPQQMLLHDGRTVREEVQQAFDKEMEVRRKIDAITRSVAERTDYESEEYLELIQRMSNLTELLSIYSTERKEAEMERTLKGLGFEASDLERPTSEFSGGWRMRIELAKILLRRPDLILLDEPTNHLDMESTIWLESFLRSSAAAVVIVSHDRAFLDNTTTRTVELSLGRAHDYKVSYTHYLRLREERHEQQLRAYQNQQRMIKKTEDFIERFRYKPTKAVQVQSRLKQLDKVERIEVDEIDRRRIHFRFPTTTPSGAYPLTITDLGVCYGTHRVLQGIELTIERGDKIALVGKNGSGKTTFVRAVMDEIPYEGVIRKGHNVEINYFAQNQAALLDGSKSIFETIDDVAEGEIRTRINDILGAFMFGGEVSEKPVHVLSGGERSRLAMIRLLLEPANLLILDEPTNHLDIPSKEVLKEAIANFDGTVLLVSHDRSFLDGLVNKVVEFRDGGIRYHLGGMADYLRSVAERQSERPPSEQRREQTDNSCPTASDTHRGEESDSGRSSYDRRREQQKALRRLQNRIGAVEREIETVEQKMDALEALFASGSSSPESLQEYETHRSALDKLMAEWEELNEQSDRLQ